MDSQSGGYDTSYVDQLHQLKRKKDLEILPLFLHKWLMV